MLCCDAMPSLPEMDPENIENLPPKSHDHDYVSVPRQPFQDLKNSNFVEKTSDNMSCISSDCNNEMLLNSSATDINTSLEKASFDTLSAFAHICNIELPVPSDNTTSTSPSSSSEQEL